MDLVNYIWPGLAVWLSWIWVAIWEWMLAKKAMQVMWKRPEMITFYSTVTILWIALVESAVIYWLVVAFQILWNPDIWVYSSIWAWLAIWLAWLWVWIWRWYLLEKSLEVMAKKPEMTSYFLTVAILWVALVESAAIYWLVIAFQILWDISIWWYAAIWAWLAIWLAWLWAWLWEWQLIVWALNAMERNPKVKWKIMTFMVLFLALVEVTAIYWLIIALKVIWCWENSLVYIWAWLAIWLAWLWVW